MHAHFFITFISVAPAAAAKKDDGKKSLRIKTTQSLKYWLTHFSAAFSHSNCTHIHPSIFIDLPSTHTNNILQSFSFIKYISTEPQYCSAAVYASPTIKQLWLCQHNYCGAFTTRVYTINIEKMSKGHICIIYEFNPFLD